MQAAYARAVEPALHATWLPGHLPTPGPELMPLPGKPEDAWPALIVSTTIEPGVKPSAGKGVPLGVLEGVSELVAVPVVIDAVGVLEGVVDGDAVLVAVHDADAVFEFVCVAVPVFDAVCGRQETQRQCRR